MTLCKSCACALPWHRYHTYIISNAIKAKQQRGMYYIAYKRNSPGRMRTVTPENQYQRLTESATALSKFPYEVQLEIKKEAMKTALRKIVNIIKHNRKTLTSEMLEAIEENEGLLCHLPDILPSPQPEGYRNKEELNIGMGADSDYSTVGLMIGRGESLLVVPNDYLKNVKPLHIEVIKTFKRFLEGSSFKRLSKTEPRNCWGQLTIRTNQKGHVMLLPELTCSPHTEELIDQAKEELQSFYISGNRTVNNVHSLYLRLRYPGRKMYTRGHQYHIGGATHLYEDLLGYTFRISPDAFFQLNTPGAGVLYSEVQRQVADSGAKTLLDIGCGTGTIGVLTSPLVKRVVGLDVIKEAVEDAQFNASLNEISNIEFHVGSARAMLKSFIADGSLLTEETVAVVNPNRNGLNKKAVMRLRCCETIKHLIYISCKPHGNALVNFVDLVVPETDELTGAPFRLVKAVAVDMFPQTIHSELVLLFQR